MRVLLLSLYCCARTNLRARESGDLAMLGKLTTLFRSILSSAPWAIGQSTFGDILGVVKDPSQGTVLAAQVVLTRVEDKSEHSATTDADGTFHFVNLRPGHYDLLISATGFAEFKISSAQLDARQTMRFDVALKLASAAQTIEVGGESGPVINTENATIGDTKDFAQITNLPVNYRGATTSLTPLTYQNLCRKWPVLD